MVKKMIKLYLISIVIWMIMMYGTAWLFEERIRENGWMNLPKSKKNPWMVLFVASATPIVRVLFFISVLIMVGMNKEKFDEWTKETNNESD